MTTQQLTDEALDTLYKEEQAVAPILLKLRREMMNDSQFTLMQFLERVLAHECSKAGSSLPIIDTILALYSAAEIRSLAASYGLELTGKGEI